MEVLGEEGLPTKPLPALATSIQPGNVGAGRLVDCLSQLKQLSQSDLQGKSVTKSNISVSINLERASNEQQYKVQVQVIKLIQTSVGS